MSQWNTEQEQFWAGEFGDEYIDRNRSQELLASNLAFFSNIIQGLQPIESIIEFGCNVGMNLRAFRQLLPGTKVSGLEINSRACEVLKEYDWIEKIYESSVFEYKPDYPRTLSFVKGVLIHLNPEKLKEAYEVLYNSSSKYILIAEYYNPSPTSIPYRGHSDRLFKRDFAGEMMQQYPDLKLVNYGFSYHGDPLFPQDDITWFVLEK
jgi:spore coat polysaccharide biosynthesis protein SpsF